MGDTVEAIGRLKLFNNRSGDHKLLTREAYSIIKEWAFLDEYLKEVYPNGDSPKDIDGDDVAGVDGTLFFCFSHYGYGFSMHDYMERYLPEKGILSKMSCEASINIEPEAVLPSNVHTERLLKRDAGVSDGAFLGNPEKYADTKPISSGDNEAFLQEIRNTNEALFESERQRLILQLKLDYYRMICAARVGLENLENEASLYAIEEMRCIRDTSAQEYALVQLQASVKALGYLNAKTEGASSIKLDDVNGVALSPFVLGLLSISYKEGYQQAAL